MSDTETGNDGHPTTSGRRGRWIRAKAGDVRRRYNEALARVGGKVTGTVAKGAHRLDEAVGDLPWRLGGLDERGTRIARGVLKEVVPKAAGERAASIADGLAIKAGAGGLGIALRLPLKPIIAPVLLVLGAVETVRAVRDVRKGVASVADRVDAEMAAEIARAIPLPEERQDAAPETPISADNEVSR